MIENIKVHSGSQELIKEITSDCISMGVYVKWVAQQLDCTVEDLVLIESQSSEDEEGWEISSFFPVSSKIEKRLIHSDMEDKNKKFTELQFNDFSIGEVLEVKYNGTKFIADRNASPIALYANKHSLS